MKQTIAAVGLALMMANAASSRGAIIVTLAPSPGFVEVKAGYGGGYNSPEGENPITKLSASYAVSSSPYASASATSASSLDVSDWVTFPFVAAAPLSLAWSVRRPPYSFGQRWYLCSLIPSLLA